ncbi:hypothetical protein BGX24_006256 [Mortierella sp. AD032]|nr:hypothetical protein BGX24_006256 [Mortierella sp. AD032]
MYMDIFDSVTQKILPVKMPEPEKALQARVSYGNVWSKYKNSIIYWGGEGTNGTGKHALDPSQNAVSELVTGTMAWDKLPMKMPDTPIFSQSAVRTAPFIRCGHCMAANEDGTKIVIYGGYFGNETVANDLWVLDVVASTWTRGRSGPKLSRATCTIAGDQFLLWGGTAMEYSVVPSKKVLIYNLTSSKYITQYTPPPFYKDLKPPPPLTRTTAPWETNSPTINKVVDGPSLPIGTAVGAGIAALALLGVIAALFIIRRRRRQSVTEELWGGKIEEDSGDTMGNLRRDQGGERGSGEQGAGGGKWAGGGYGEGPKNNPQDTNEGEDVEKRLEMLKIRQKEIDQTRQLLVQQHQESNPQPVSLQKRAPTAFTDNNYPPEVISSPSTLLQLSPIPAHSSSLLPEELTNRRTVQAASAQMEMHQGDSYADDDRPRGKRESELTQDVVEPLYELGPEAINAIPDLVYTLPVPAPGEVDSASKQQQRNDPHAVLGRDTAESDVAIK